MEENSRYDRIPAQLWAVVLVAGIVLGFLGVLTWVAVGPDSEEPAPVAGPPSPTSTGTPREDGPVTASRPVAAGRLERCADAAQALGVPLEAARPALEQWKVHVGAMNKLVVGAITLQQASDFWNRTRLGAERRVEHFEDAHAALRRHGVDCPAPQLMAPGTQALRPCARQVEAQVRVLAAAGTSIRTWHRHVREMDMLRKGTLSPAKATDMWLAMWKRGVRDLRTYRQALREPRLTAGCPAPGPPG